MANPRKRRAKLSVSGETACVNCPLRKRPIFRQFDAKELEFVEWFKTAELVAEPGAGVLTEGQVSPHLYTILSGWAFRYKMLPDSRRQILNFAMPGDLVGLQGPVMNEMQHSVEALTNIRLCVFPRERLWKLYALHPELAHDLVWLAMRGERMADEHLLALGQRSASERIGYLLLHLYNRCRALDLANGSRFALPLTQRHIADSLGLSLVHTNKTLRRLAAQKLVRFSESFVDISNELELRRIAHYDENDGDRRPLI